MLNNISANRAKTALCVGKVSKKRRLRFIEDPLEREEFLTIVKQRLAFLISQGYDTFLFTSWSYFDYLLCQCLKDIDSELLDATQPLFLMAVIRDNEYDEDLPDPDEFFEFIIDQDQENINLTEKERISQLLENVSALVYDNIDLAPDVVGFIQKAREMNMMVVDLTESLPR